MKKILITGQNSYIGNSLEQYLQVYQEKYDCSYEVDKVSLRSNEWQEQSWKDYDAIVHVAGIAHVDTAGASEETRQRYYEVNTNLTREAAIKAKDAGVGQFIFLSSMIVFGESSPCGEGVAISGDTQPAPVGFYGDSKLQAERAILPLETEEFKVAIVRPPMVYGKGSKGNYPRLARLAGLTPIFPKVANKHSMIYIEHLCELLRLLIEGRKNGIYHPQNHQVDSTTKLVKTIAESHKHTLWCVRVPSFVIRFLTGKSKLFLKVFGDFYYAQELSEYPDMNYRVCDFEESISRTEM